MTHKRNTPRSQVKTFCLILTVLSLATTATQAGDIDVGPGYRGHHPGYRPSPPSRGYGGSSRSRASDAAAITGGILNIVGGAIQQSQSRQHTPPPRPQPRHYVPQTRTPQYRPVTPRPTTTRVVRPSVPRNVAPQRKETVVARSVPKNAVPRPKPKKVSAPRNTEVEDIQFLTLTEEERREAEDLLHQEREDQIEEIDRVVTQYNMIGEGIIEQGLPIPDADKQRVIGMMAAGDVAGLENYFQQNPLPNVGDAKLRDAVMEIAMMNNGLADLHNASGRDVTPETFANALDAFTQQQGRVSGALQTAYQNPAMRNNIRDIDRDFEAASQDAATLNSILASLGTPNGGNGTWPGGAPDGDIWSLYVPGLPGGHYYPFDGGMVCGTGGTGSFYYTQESVTDALGFPVSSDQPVADAFSGGYGKNSILISNPDDNGGSISFLLDNQTVSLSPGEEREFNANSKLLIEFDPGNSGASRKYSLKPGQSFKFVVIDGAWDLRERTVEVVIDNSENEQDFLYVADNEVVRVPAGDERVHSSSRPIEVRFDRGDGDEARKLLEAGRYSVAVNTDSLKWDLHQQDKIRWSDPVADYQ